MQQPILPTVSVIMPVRNESRYIAECIESLLLQDYPLDDMEWIFVDGNSEDNTKDIIESYIVRYPSLIKVYDNPNKIVPYAMNIGIRASRGRYIVRLDAHAEYATDYISKSVYHLEKTGADNVGGLFITKAKTKMGKRIALMLTSKFGVGNANFRVNGQDGYVDTVPFGAFRRETFDKYGFFDERLTRNQDNELNWRIRKNGGKVYMSRDIKLTYYCRDTIKDIVAMAMKNGKWNVVTMRLCPGSMGVRHFVPLVFLMSLIIMPILSVIWLPFALLFAAEMSLYFLLDVICSTKLTLSAEEDASLMTWLSLMILFPIFHISYGFGSILGVLALGGKTFRKTLMHQKAYDTLDKNKEPKEAEKIAN